MPPKQSEFTRIFAKRVACAGISLALALTLTACPRPAPPAVTPAQITSIFTVGTIALETGDPRALDRLTRALKLAPQEPAIWANMGLYRLRNNELDAASFDLERARALAAQDTPATSRAGIEALLALVADKRGDLAGAVAHSKQAVALNPDDLKIRYALAGQQERNGDDAGALRTMQDILQKRPDNLDALLQSARLAAQQNHADILRPLVAKLDAQSAAWSSLSKEQMTELKTLSQGASVQRASLSVRKLLNTLKQQPQWRVSFAALNPPLDNLSNPVLGTPLERFARLSNVADTPAPPDMGLTFTPKPIAPDKETGRQGDRETGSASSLFVGALWLNNTGAMDSLVAPFAIHADGHALHIDAPAYANQPLAFPGEPYAAPLGPHGVLALDFDYDLKADIFMAGSGGLKLYLQDVSAHYKDVTSSMKLPPDVLNGAYTGAWGLDYDTDGDLDILLARSVGPPLVLRNNGDGTFKPAPLFSEVSGLRDFAWADIDGDGSADAALVDGAGNLHIYMNERSGKFRARALPPDVGKIAAVAAADLDNDGKIDFILLRTDGAIVRLSDRMDGTQWDMAVVAQWANVPKDLAPGTARLLIADLDNNGALDIIAASPTLSQVWMSDGYKFAPLPTPIAAGIQAVADLDGDGRLDLLGISAQGDPVTFTNRGTKNYFWQDVRTRADERGEVVPSHNRSGSEPAQLSKRVNSYGIGGEIEMRAGLLYQKQVITAPSTHFGLGTYPTLDVARIIWPNGDVRGEFELKNNAVLSANHRLNVSCPFLFTWNGEEMTFVTDCIWRSPLGLKINAQDTHGVQMTEDWVKIRGDQLQPTAGVRIQESGVRDNARANKSLPDPRPLNPDPFYDVRITADLWETHFFDHLSLMAVDHPVGTEIFCDERFAVPPPPLSVYCTTPPTPVSRAWDDDGNDVTDIVRERDGRHVANFPKGAYQGVTREHWLAVELPDFASGDVHSDTPADAPLYLIAHGWVHPTNSSVNLALSQGSDPVPQGLVLDAMGADGQWHTRKEDLGFPAGKLKTVVLRVDDAFLTGAPRQIRLRTNLEVYWEAVGWAVGLPDATIQMTRLAAQSADLRYRGFSEIFACDDSSPELPVSYNELECTGQKWRDLEGYYTRYGDVRELLADIDDRYVIMNAGDEMRLTFDAPPLPPDGWTRDFVLIGDGWVKDGNPNTAFSKTVLPLPAHDTPTYDTPPGLLEDDPIYQRHSDDWQNYHTRYVTADRFRRSLQPLTPCLEP